MFPLASLAVTSSALTFTVPSEPVLAKTVNINISPLPAGMTGFTNSIKLLVTIIESALARPDTLILSNKRMFGCWDNSNESSFKVTLLAMEMDKYPTAYASPKPMALMVPVAISSKLTSKVMMESA